MSKLGSRVFVGIPTLSKNPRTNSWITAMAGLQFGLGSSATRMFIEDKPIAEARNEICRMALESGAEYIFMLGDDVLPPSNVILELLDKIDSYYPSGKDNALIRADMITGIYWTKTYPPEPYIFNSITGGSYQDWKVGEFFPVNLAGCDCLLFSTRILKEMPFPWFSTEWTSELGQPINPGTTEDFYFYTKARNYGFHLFADTSIQCLHEDRNTGTGFGLQPQMKQVSGMPINVEDNEMLFADIGAGHWGPEVGKNTKIVRFDARSDVRPDVRCDVRNIPSFWFNKFDYAFASHVLEHFPRIEVRDLVKHWSDLLKVGGTLEIRVPNMEVAFRTIIEAVDNPDKHASHYMWQMIYGDQRNYDTAFHRVGFVRQTLAQLLISLGIFEDISVTPDAERMELVAKAKLVKHTDVPAILEWWKEIDAKEGITTHNLIETPVHEDTTPVQETVKLHKELHAETYRESTHVEIPWYTDVHMEGPEFKDDVHNIVLDAYEKGLSSHHDYEEPKYVDREQRMQEETPVKLDREKQNLVVAAKDLAAFSLSKGN